MADVTNELMVELLKTLQDGQRDIKAHLNVIREEIGAMRSHMAGFQTDIGNLYSTQIEINKELERVKLRLNLTDVEQ